MKILSFNWHTPYLSMLARLEHKFEIAPPNIDTDRMGSWDEAMRPLPGNVNKISRDEMRERLFGKRGYYDLLLAHNVKDIIMAKEARLPKLLVFHNKLSTEAALGKKPEIAKEYRESVRNLVSGVYCVFISQAKRHDWGLPGEIIMPGIDASMYGGYTGAARRVLRVGNSIKARDLMTGYSTQEAVLEGIPSLLLGENPDIPNSRVSKDWDELKEAYRENRLLLNTTMAPWEDGYNLTVLEAMATGMPVISIANPTSPITDGVDGFTGETVEELREKVAALLDDHELAKQIGAEGRKTVEKLFPMSVFLAKWDSAIRRAADWYPALPERFFTPREPAKKKKPSYKPAVPGGKNVLLSYTSYPATAGAYIERAFRKKSNVITAGSRITPHVVDVWNLGNLKVTAHKHDIHFENFTIDVGEALERTPDNFNPELFVWVETALGSHPRGLEKLSIPKAAYLIDTHIHKDLHLQIAKNFDVTFLAQRAYIDEFKGNGIKNVFWLPLACDPQIHGKAEREKEHDVGFVGSLTDDRRVSLLMRLAEKMDVGYKRAFLREMADFFSGSRIIFNNAIRNDLNMRVFEALCSGSLLLTDPADGLDEFFTDREHLVVYNDENIIELAEHYLRNPEEREAIADAGRREALASHTYEHRVEDILRVVESVEIG